MSGNFKNVISRPGKVNINKKILKVMEIVKVSIFIFLISCEIIFS